MDIRKITNKAIWENFLLRCEEKTFLNSWGWGEFQLKMGEKIWRLGIYNEGELFSSALVVRVAARRGTFLFVPHLIGIKNKELRIKVVSIITQYLKELAKREGAVFIRIAPAWERNEENEKIFRELGFRTAPTHMHSEVMWELDIGPSEEELLAGMRKTTRYLIRQAMKNQELTQKDVEIVKSCNAEDVDKFYNLHKETVGRHHFTPFSLDYIKKEFKSFAGDDEIAIFHGKYQGEPIASAIIVFWQGTAYYHHGATSMKYPKIPAAYLLQWEIIKEAKRRGCTKYNLWGITPLSIETESGNSQSQITNHKFQIQKNHPWYGLTLFKTGFGGYKKEYIKTQDLPLSWKYWPIAIFEILRRKKRGL